MKKDQRSLGKIFQDIFTSILIALFIAVILKVFFLGVYFVPTSSMEPTIQTESYIVVWKFLYNNKIPVWKKDAGFGWDIDRRDIVVFHVPGKEDDYVKRVIGLPGDRIRLEKKKVFINDVELGEKYLLNMQDIEYDRQTFNVPKGKLFVMGDNRNNSEDSREDEVGYINMDNIIGKVIFIY